MNVAVKMQPQSTDIAVIVSQTPVVVLTDKAQRESFYAHIEREVEGFVADVSTDKGRKEIASMAFKVTKTKTAIDAAGKQLNEDARAQINAVDAERRACKEYLTALATKVRQPLTDWETAEEARIARADAMIADFKALSVVGLDDTSADVRERGTQVFGTELTGFGDRSDDVQAAKDLAVQLLKISLAQKVREEADRAELEALRAANAEREAREQAAAEAKALAEHEAQVIAEREAAELAAQKAAEQAKADREAREERIATEAAQRAAEKAQRDAEAAAQAERDKLAREHAEALAAEKRRADELAKADADRKAEIVAAAAEQARLAKNRAHRAQIMGETKLAIMAAGSIDEAAAVLIVKAIVAGTIAHTTLRF